VEVSESLDKSSCQHIHTRSALVLHTYTASAFNEATLRACFLHEENLIRANQQEEMATQDLRRKRRPVDNRLRGLVKMSLQFSSPGHHLIMTRPRVYYTRLSSRQPWPRDCRPRGSFGLLFQVGIRRLAPCAFSARCFSQPSEWCVCSVPLISAQRWLSHSIES
jgi:hypothetical protein